MASNPIGPPNPNNNVPFSWGKIQKKIVQKRQMKLW